MIESKLPRQFCKRMDRLLEPWASRSFWIGWLGLLVIGIVARTAAFVVFESNLANLLGSEDSMIVVIYLVMLPLMFTSFGCICVALLIRGSLLLRVGLALSGNAIIEVATTMVGHLFRFEAYLRSVGLLVDVLAALSPMIAFICALSLFKGYYFVLEINQPLGQKSNLKITISMLLEWVVVAAVAFVCVRIRLSPFAGEIQFRMFLDTTMTVFIVMGRFIALVDRASVRRKGRLIAMLLTTVSLGFLTKQQAEWPCTSASECLRIATIATLSMVFYWFVSLVPILWMRANGWEIVSDRSSE